jgi:hypothetical protein
MKIAILIYGYFFIDENMTLIRAPHSKKQLNKYSFVNDSFNHFMSHIYIPLKKIYEIVDVYMIAHKFAHPKFEFIKKELHKTCDFFNIYWTDKIESPRLTCSYFNLIKFCLNSKIKYDRYIITRNDIFYKQKISYWNPPNNNSNFCYYLFKDYAENWNNGKKISDIIFIIDGDLKKFQNSIKNYIIKYPIKSDMHDIYIFLEREYNINISHIVEGNYDSNTAKNIKDSYNPIYIMINRLYYFDQNGIKLKNGNIFSLHSSNAIIKNIINNSK